MYLIDVLYHSDASSGSRSASDMVSDPVYVCYFSLISVTVLILYTQHVIINWEFVFRSSSSYCEQSARHSRGHSHRALKVKQLLLSKFVHLLYMSRTAKTGTYSFDLSQLGVFLPWKSRTS